MAERLMVVQFGAREVAITTAAAIHRDKLYGKQCRSVVKDGTPLEQVVLDPEGNVFLPPELAYLATDSAGSLATAPLTQTEEGELLDLKPSSYRVTRELTPAGIEVLARLRVDAVIPVKCEITPGFYTTEYSYHDAPQLKTAVLNVTADGAFLLTGTPVEAPLQGKNDVYNFFDDPESERDDSDEDGLDDLTFDMF